MAQIRTRSSPVAVSGRAASSSAMALANTTSSPCAHACTVSQRSVPLAVAARAEDAETPA